MKTILDRIQLREELNLIQIQVKGSIKNKKPLKVKDINLINLNNNFSLNKRSRNNQKYNRVERKDQKSVGQATVQLKNRKEAKHKHPKMFITPS